MAIVLVSKFCLQITLLQDLAVGDVPLARAPGTGFSIYPVPAAKKKISNLDSNLASTFYFCHFQSAGLW